MHGRRNKKKSIARWLRRHELMMRIHGPAMRARRRFVSDWCSESDVPLEMETSPMRMDSAQGLVDAQVAPSGPSVERGNNLKLFVAMIRQATERAFGGAFCARDWRLDVVYHAQRSHYRALLRAGVKILLLRAPEVPTSNLQ